VLTHALYESPRSLLPETVRDVVRMPRVDPDAQNLRMVSPPSFLEPLERLQVVVEHAGVEREPPSVDAHLFIGGEDASVPLLDARRLG
jgi:hypothetical protein